MEIVLETKFNQIYKDPAHPIVYNRWNDFTEDMTPEEFKEEILILKEIVLQAKPKGILGNTQDFMFVISPEVQEWISSVYFPDLVKNGLEKYAIIVSKDFITKLSVDQTIEEEKSKTLFARYFDNEEEAYAWLIK